MGATMKLGLIILLQVIFLSFHSIYAFAEIKTITHTIRQPFGGSQSPDDARTTGIARAKREAIEKFGPYIKNTTVIKESKLDSDDILALVAGVTTTEVIKQKNYAVNDSFGLEITVKIALDSTTLDKDLKRLLEDRNLLIDLKEARVRENELLGQVEELQIGNKISNKSEEQSAIIKDRLRMISNEITALECYFKSFDLIYSNPNKAIEYLSQAINLEPKVISAYYNNRGLAYSKLKQHERAISDYDKALNYNSDLPDVYFNRGISYVEHNQYKLAIIDYDNAIRLNSNNAKYYFNRGNVYLILKKYNSAILDYDKAIRLNSKYVKAFTSRGLSYAKLKQFDQAISDYNQAIYLDPKYAPTYSNRGIVYYELNQFELAIKDYDQTIRLDPKLAEAFTNRANANVALKKFDRSIVDYSHVIRLDLNNANAYYNRGVSYMKLNQVQKGCSDLKKSCQLGLCDGYDLAQRKNMCK